MLGGAVWGSRDPGCSSLNSRLHLDLDLDLGRGRGLEASASTKALKEVSRSRSGTAHGKRRRSMQTCVRLVSFVNELEEMKCDHALQLQIWVDPSSIALDGS